MKFLMRFCAILFLFLVTSCSSVVMNNEYDLSNGKWRFTEDGKNDTLKAFIPGTVQTDLLKNKKIPEFYYRTNENSLQWIGEKNWVYETYFDVPEELSARSNIEMEFGGLDTHAKVYLNEKEILNADNFFRTWKVDVKKLLKPTNNHLRIFFFSSVIFDKEQMAKEKTKLINDYVYTRKPAYHFGWDWGPVFITTGIWKPIILKAWDSARILDMQIYQTELKKDYAKLEIKYEINADSECEVELFTECEAAGQKVTIECTLQKGLNTITVPMRIEDPKLWWPKGAGDQFLYQIKGEASKGNKIFGSTEKNIGLRTIRLIQKPDAIGKTFYFEVNGIPVFMKGANYIPLDMFVTRPTEKEYENVIDQALAANMNMLRVWGGGFYENDIFYNLCDKKGILLWHDFMFACNLYPGDEQFLNNVKEEVTENIKRLRNHPSIALWCGNNENYVGWKDWGWVERFTKAESAKVWNDYEKVFQHLIPDLITKYDSSRSYWPSSPLYAYGYPVNTDGDVHYWGIWHAQEPFEEFTKTKNIGRFVSEYGFQGTPEMNSIKKFTLPEDRAINSEVMKLHQKHKIGYPVIDKYQKWYYKDPKNFESYLLVSQLMQAYGIGMAIETHRAAMPHCMGTLFWQLNDLYPVTSWASIDYYGRWKAVQYLARDLYKKTIIVPQVENEKLNIKIVTDELAARKAELKMELIDFEGKVLKTEKREVEISPNTSKIYYDVQLAELLKGAEKNRVVLNCSLNENNSCFVSKIFYFVLPKDLGLSDPQISYTMVKKESGYMISLTAKKLAKGVFISFEDIDGTYSNNYFDMLPGQTYDIVFKPDKPVELTVDKLKLLSLFNTY